MEESRDAVEFILDTLRTEEAHTITITASGPLTNIAQAFLREPDTMRKVKQIVIMGGCTEEMDAADRPKRQGNITPYAEFNFQQAAADAETVMNSGLPITLLPMNCTHQLTVTPERQKALVDAYPVRTDVRRALVGIPDIQTGRKKPEEVDQKDRGLVNSPAHLEREKFDIESVMHDIHCAFYILYPEEYIVQSGNVEVKRHQGVLTSDNMWDSDQGQTVFTPDETSNLKVATGIEDPDKLFGIFKDSLTAVIPPEKAAGLLRV